MVLPTLLLLCALPVLWCCHWFWSRIVTPRPVLYHKTKPAVKPGFCVHRKPDWVVHEIIRFKALMPDSGCRHIAHVFNRCFALSRNVTVSKSYVNMVLRQQALAVIRLRKEIRNRQPGPSQINQIWALDLTGKQDVYGYEHGMLGLIDHGSRRLLKLTALPNKTAFTFLGYLLLAMGQYGKPKFVRTDNERVFTSRLFRLALKLAGIAHQHSDLHCPWQNGRIERLFGTLKQKLDQVALNNANHLQSALNQFAFWYNAVRPHQHLNGLTPLEVWGQRNPYRNRPKCIEYFSAWDGLLTGYYIRC